MSNVFALADKHIVFGLLFKYTGYVIFGIMMLGLTNLVHICAGVPTESLQQAAVEVFIYIPIIIGGTDLFLGFLGTAKKQFR